MSTSTSLPSSDRARVCRRDVHLALEVWFGTKLGVDGVQHRCAVAVREWKRKRKVYRLGGFHSVPKGPPELPSLRLPVGDGLVASRVPAARRVRSAHGPVVVLEYLPLLDVVHHRERQRLPRGVALDTKVEPRSVMRGAVAPLAVGPGPQLYIGSVLLALAQVTAVEVGADRVLAQPPSIILRDLRRPARDSPSPFRGRFGRATARARRWRSPPRVATGKRRARPPAPPLPSYSASPRARTDARTTSSPSSAPRDV